MNSPLLGLRTVVYHTADLAAAKAWYAQALETPPYFDEPFYVGFSVGGFELGLVPDGKSGVGGTDAYWGVAQVDEAVARLVGLGATVRDPAQDVGGGIRAAVLLDPFGNSFGVISNPHFTPAQVR